MSNLSPALYRKYRSKNLAEVIGQDHITRTLDAALKSGKISHAYLFTGPRGVGKTSVARILAHAINGLEYIDDQTIHLDIIEIDAASNRRIDEIRDLRDKVHIAPTSAKYKVYIIDEVHMLTKEAFNALLKTLEEPPAHVVFILATTELQKVPETIVSRTQRFVFKHIDKQDSMNHMRDIATKEGITIDDEALGLIAEHAEGGFRDAISLLDQIRHYGTTINAQIVADALGVVPSASSETLWRHISNDVQAEAVTQLKHMQDDGIQPVMIAKALTEKAITAGDAKRARLFLYAAASKDAKTELLLAILESTTKSEKTSDKREETAANTHQQTAETSNTIIKVQEATTPKKQPDSEPVEEPAIKKKSQEPSMAPKPVQSKTVELKTDISKPSATTTPIESEESPETKESTDEPYFWPQVLDTLKESGHIIYAPLRLAKPELEGNKLILTLDFPFHIKRLEEPANLSHLLDVVSKFAKSKLSISFQKTAKQVTVARKQTAEETTSAPKAPSEPKEPISELPNPLSMVQNIFGNAELM